MDYTSTIGVFAIIFDSQKRVLLCHRRDYDLWNLPGGGLQKGEAPWEGVIRETKEEVGVGVEIERLSGIYFKPEQDEIVFSFVCQVVGGEIAVSEEADEAKYFAFAEIPKDTSPKQVERIKDALEDKSSVSMKIQRGPRSIDLLWRRDGP